MGPERPDEMPAATLPDEPGEREQVRLGDLVFDVRRAGDAQAPPVLCLHGFPHSHHGWRHLLAGLPAHGYRVIAPDQRGYSPGARPAGIDAYATERLVADALAVAEAFDAPRFHLVGHDWGGHLAWLIAARHPERLASLTVLSRPHPAAFAEAMAVDPAQARRSTHHRAFLEPDAASRLLADGTLRRALVEAGVPAADADVYLAPLSTPAALDAALNWYRAAARGPGSLAATEVPAVEVPTLYLWGDADHTVGRHAAEATAARVSGPLRFEVLAGAGHFLVDQVGERVVELVLEHLRAWPLLDLGAS